MLHCCAPATAARIPSAAGLVALKFITVRRIIDGGAPFAMANLQSPMLPVSCTTSTPSLPIRIVQHGLRDSVSMHK